MRCVSCGHNNLDDAQFCDQCGADFVPVCPACSAENQPGARFCRKCRAPQSARLAGDRLLEHYGWEASFIHSLAQGDMVTAHDVHGHATRLAEELKIGIPLYQARSRSVALSLGAGLLADVEATVVDAFQFGQSMGSATALAAFGVQMFVLRWYQGRLAELEGMWKTVVEQSPNVAGYRAALALTFAETGRANEARPILDSLVASGFGNIPEDLAWSSSMVMSSEVCAWLEDGAAARQLYDVVSRHPGGSASLGDAVSVGAMGRSLGQLATLLERWEDAERHFTDALDLNEKMGHRPALAQTRRDYATMLVRRDGPGDRARALPLVQQALDAAQEMGMQKLVEDCLALKLEGQGIDRAEFSASAALNTSIDRVATAVESQHPDLRKQAAPDGTVTIMFSDIEGSTEKTAQLGDTKWMEVLRDHGAIIRGQLRAHDGFEVKSEGDGFMLAFQSGRKALLCAIAMQKAFEAHNETAETPVRVRMGLHTGEVIKDGDDFFGIHVNLAARVAGKATGGEILASSLLKELTASGGDIAFGDPRTVEFKGIDGEHHVWPVQWS